MTDQPRELGEVYSYTDLHRLMRLRAAELKISRSEIDRLAGLASGHAGKILAPRPLRRAGDQTIPFLLPALGMKLIAVEDLQAVERIKTRAEPRDEGKDHSSVVILEFSRRHFRRIGRKGGQNSRRFLSPKERTRLARRAGLASAEARRKRRRQKGAEQSRSASPLPSAADIPS
jgi:hypothetical protein